MVIFYSFLNISGINAQIIYKSNKAADKNNNVSMTRREFLKKLALDLIQPHLLDRLKEPRLTIELRHTILKITKLKSDTVAEWNAEDNGASNGFCAFCPRRKNRKTKKHCCNCSSFICNEHTAFFCMDCQQKLTDSIN